MSDSTWNDGGLTPLERAAGVWSILYGKNEDDEAAREFDDEEDLGDRKSGNAQQIKDLENSERFRTAAKIVAGLPSNRDIKLALLRKVHQDSLRAAIVRYLTKEQLPNEYAALVESPECIRALVEGIFFRVCKLKATQAHTDEISALSSALRSNANQLTAYDRVGRMQQFIHRCVDQSLGVGAARVIPVTPMKNALSAARLHLGIVDLQRGRPAYILFMDAMSKAVMQREYDDPRDSTAPYGKQSLPRWRVRHLQPLSYFFPASQRELIRVISNIDESTERAKFVEKALHSYAGKGQP